MIALLVAGGVYFLARVVESVSVMREANRRFAAWEKQERPS